MTMQTFTGLEYLKIDIASNFGLDKEDWDVRLNWFEQNKGNLTSLINQAEEPALYYAGVLAYFDTLNGEASGYMVSQDATSSGLQLLACLTGDDIAARLCNVIDTGHREDAYTNIYNEMSNRIGNSATIQRKDTKRAIMTSLYSSTAVPKEVFGEGRLLEIFYETMNDMAPAAWALNEAMLSFWNPQALSHDWVLPDNFHVQVKVMTSTKETIHFLNAPHDIVTKVNAPMDEGRSLGANITHSVDGMVVRELVMRCDYDPNQIAGIKALLHHGDGSSLRTLKSNSGMVQLLWNHYRQSGYLSARILDFIDRDSIRLCGTRELSELVQSLPPKPFKVVSVHDCFRFLPNYGNELRKQYNLQLMLIAKSELLSYLITQLLGKQVQIKKMNPDLHKHIMDTNYALS